MNKLPETQSASTLHRYGAASDADVARALAASDRAAMREAYNRLAPMVLRLTQRHLGSRADADDITQEVFCRLYLKAGALREASSLRSFVYRFTTNAIRIERRRRQRREWLTLEPPETVQDLTACAPNPEARQLLTKVEERLTRLKPRDRRILLMRRIEAMTLQEIAGEMNLPLSTVKRSVTQSASKLSRWGNATPQRGDE